MKNKIYILFLLLLTGCISTQGITDTPKRVVETRHELKRHGMIIRSRCIITKYY